MWKYSKVHLSNYTLASLMTYHVTLVLLVGKNNRSGWDRTLGKACLLQLLIVLIIKITLCNKA